MAHVSKKEGIFESGQKFRCTEAISTWDVPFKVGQEVSIVHIAYSHYDDSYSIRFVNHAGSTFDFEIHNPGSMKEVDPYFEPIKE